MEYAVASPSQAHTIGNITAFATDFIKKLFPDNYFKTVNVASQIAYRQFNVMNTKAARQIVRRGKPILIIRPRIDINNPDGFLADTLLTTRMTDNVYENGFGNLQDFVYDPTGETAIKFLMNRVKVSFDVTVIVETSMEQINMAYALKNTTRMNHPFFLNTYLENHIPRQIINALATDKNIDIADIRGLLDYMNANTSTPVTYKMKNSTGNDEFFRFYPTNVESIIENFDTDEGSKKNMIDDAYTINFTLTMEYWSAGLFYYFTRNPKTVRQMPNEVDPTSTVVPMLTVHLDLPDLDFGWDIYANAAFRVDESRTAYTLDFTPLLSPDIQAVVAFCHEKSMPYDGLLDVIVMKDDQYLTPGVDFVANIGERNVEILNSNSASTYRFFLIMHTSYINELILTLHNLEDET